MRHFITAALLAATSFAGVASAQSAGELRRDRQDIRQERRDLDRAHARGDRDDIRDQRGDLRDARREFREDRRDYRDDRRDDWRDRRWGRDDWRGYRDRNGSLYARGGWRAPFRYTSFRAGSRIAPAYYGRTYWIADPYRYRLPVAGGYRHWVRHYDDVLLIDTRRGVVVDVIRGFWR